MVLAIQKINVAWYLVSLAAGLLLVSFILNYTCG